MRHLSVLFFMDKRAKLNITKSIHTVIYFIMVAAVFYTFFCAVTATRNYLLLFCIILVALEGIVFFVNGRECPFTSLAKKYGDEKGYVGDMFVSRRIAESTFKVFGVVFFLSVIILFLGKA